MPIVTEFYLRCTNAFLIFCATGFNMGIKFKFQILNLLFINIHILTEGQAAAGTSGAICLLDL